MSTLGDEETFYRVCRNFTRGYVEWKQILRDYRALKFDQLQPRKPSGPGGGQWTSGGGANSMQIAGQSAAFCWNQMLIDMLLCGSLEPAWYRAACRSQANERYSACLSGKPIPPLPF